jgi:ammonium transporter Rh
MIAYTLNAILLNDFLKVYDVGGSIFCHTFGAYFGMGLSLVISRYRRPITKIEHNYETIIFSYIGCFLIFCFVPSINSQYLTETPF